MDHPEVQQAGDALRASDPDLQEEHTIRASSGGGGGGCPFAHTTTTSSSNHHEPLPYQFIPLPSGSHKVTESTKRLIAEEVSFQDLKQMTEHFYQLAFRDQTLDTFIRSHHDPHADRFAKWIHQKLSGSDLLWDQDRQTRDLTPVALANDRMGIVRDRTSAHIAAWFSPKRPEQDVGRRFQLDECRVWMRLHFWAMRQAGLVEKSPTFADYYVRFIGHFVAVYEKRATKFARESFRWSADPKNTEAYLHGGRSMKDVLGVKHTEAKQTLPEEELDYQWPHHQ